MELTEQVQRRCYADITERNQRGSGGWIDIASAGSPRLLKKEKEWTQIRTSGSEEPTTRLVDANERGRQDAEDEVAKEML